MKSTFDNVSPFIQTDKNADASALRDTMNENGYLFFRGLLPAEDVLSVRRDVLQLCSEAGWLDASCNVTEGIAAPGHVPLREGMPEYTEVYRKILKTQSFFVFPTNPLLMNIARKELNQIIHAYRNCSTTV